MTGISQAWIAKSYPKRQMPKMSILKQVSSEQRIVHMWNIDQVAVQTDHEQQTTGKHYQGSLNAELSTRRSGQAVTDVFFFVFA